MKSNRQALYAAAALALVLLCAHLIQVSFIAAAACVLLAGVCVVKGELWEVRERGS